jgi:hypothetical protein
MDGVRQLKTTINKNNTNNFRGNQLPAAARGSIADIRPKHRVSALSHLQGN